MPVETFVKLIAIVKKNITEFTAFVADLLDSFYI